MNDAKRQSCRILNVEQNETINIALPIRCKTQIEILDKIYIGSVPTSMKTSKNMSKT